MQGTGESSRLNTTYVCIEMYIELKLHSLIKTETFLKRTTYLHLGGLIKMENIAPRVGIEPTSLGFWVRVLTISPPSFNDVTTISMPTCLCGSFPEGSVPITTLATLEL